MGSFLHTRRLSFKYAFEGLGYVLRSQPNTWIHLLATILAALMALWLRLPPRDWAVLVLVFGLVWMAECFNTSVEAIVDLLSPQQHPAAKIAKDVAAAAVLVTAIAAVFVGLLILGPPLFARISAG